MKYTDLIDPNYDDPFGFLESLSVDKIMREDEMQTLFEHRDSAQYIVAALSTNKFVAP